MEFLGGALLRLGAMGSICGFSLAWGLIEDKAWKKRCIIIGIISMVLMIVGGIMFWSVMPSGGVSSSNSDSERCRICDTAYSDRDNVKSIRYRNMCERCYKNYKYASGY